MENDSGYVRYSDLADGETLLALKKGYLEERGDEALYSLLSCLKESFVMVPMIVKMSDRDEIRLQEAKCNGTLESFKSLDEIRVSPDTLRDAKGDSYMAIFSNSGQMPEEYAKRYTNFEEAVPNCIAIARAMTGLKGLVLDAFTQAFVIPFDMAEVLLKTRTLHGNGASMI